ncbi:F-box protein SKIP23 [Bienertia sinuspersici]
MAEEEIQPDWSEIPDDILFKIAQTLPIYSDYIRLRAVCLKWRITLPSTPLHTLPCQLPWLLLPPSSTSIKALCNNITTITNTRRTFYNILTNKLHTFHLLESTYPRRILGSSHGYLIITSETPEIFCFNPLTKSKIFLPPLSSLPGVISFKFSNVGREYMILDQSNNRTYHLDLKQMRDEFIRKIVLSSSPSNNGSTPSFAFAITTSFLTHSTELVFCTVNQNNWVSVPVSDFPAEDVIYCQSQKLFYAVNHLGNVGSFRIDENGICDVTIWETVNSIIPGDMKYLVLINEELMLLTRHLCAEADVITYCELNRTVSFEVYRFCECGSQQVWWDPVMDLGDKVVFVGESSSLALSASDFPGCKANCIYFTDDHSKCNDIGVYDLKEECVEALPCFPEDVSLPLSWESPIWISPNPR